MKNRRDLLSVLLLAPALTGVTAPGAAVPTPAKPPARIQPAAADWPQWRGPERNGVAVGSPRLLDAWPAAGPPRLWTRENIPVGDTHGWSSAVAAGGCIYIEVSVNGRDIVYCLKVADGSTVIQGGKHDGPHANRGGVVALDAADGRALWFAPKHGGQGSPVLWRTGRSSWTKGGPGAIVCYDLRAGN